MKNTEFHGYCGGCSERIEGEVIRVNPYGGLSGPDCSPFHPGHEPSALELRDLYASRGEPYFYCSKCGTPETEIHFLIEDDEHEKRVRPS